MYPLKNKGKYLESLLNITHQKYLEEDICVVSNISPGVYFTNPSKNLNFKANFNCDYIGIYKHHYFEFEAKETYQEWFDFKAFRPNQIKKLTLVRQHGGIAFMIVYFANYDEFYLTSFDKIANYVKENKNRVPYEWFNINSYQLYLDSHLKLDYLKFLNYLFN
ncbi:Holliday junction resolvase RecU [[Acholeplasma] multilocale]|uniref:Holliday junction resolvase RecU n=1 Tax=[Acholeplasma] multilocale TaxID=264638 RepID=UPI00047B239E|nr:Holliday junction resolvase RecU [[Acholeplasma] multilocale]